MTEREERVAAVLRAARTLDIKVRLALEAPCAISSVAGRVEYVSPTSAIADVAGVRVPLRAVAGFDLL